MARSGRALKTAFLDSSVLFTAVNSPFGGSSKLFTLKSVELITSRVVLAETERNVVKKLPHYHVDRFRMLVGKLKILNQIPDESAIENARKVIVKKDSVILAEARKAKTDFLVTLDKKHFLKRSVKEFLAPQKVLTPKKLIEMEG